MVDAFCPYGGDFQLDQYGCIQEAVGWDEVEQEISRVLYTNPTGFDKLQNYQQPDWIFYPLFGLGLMRLIGNFYDSKNRDKIIASATEAIVSNPAVAKYPPPTVQIFPDGHNLNLYLNVPLANKEQGEIVFPIGGA